MTTPSPAIATWFSGSATDKSHFWLITRNQLIFRRHQPIAQNGMLAKEVNTTLESAYFAYDEMDQLFQAIQATLKRMPSVQIRLIGHSMAGRQA